MTGPTPIHWQIEKARRSELPQPARDQARVDRLVAMAQGDFPIDPSGTRRAALVRLLAGVWLHNGRSINFPHGYVRAVMLAVEGAGMHRPTRPVVRWHRSALQDDPLQFAQTPGVPVDLLEQMADLGP